jgi:protein AroM
MAAILGPGFTLVERGALDHLRADQVAALAPEPGRFALITLLRDGTAVKLDKPRLLPLLQNRIAELEAEGVDAVAVLCTGAFPVFDARVPVVRPQEALYSLAKGLAAPGRVGVLVPLPEQVAQAEAQCAAIGMEAAVAVASPYNTQEAQIADSVRAFARADVSLCLLDCFGYSQAMKRAVRGALGRPVLLARSALARVLAEVS